MSHSHQPSPSDLALQLDSDSDFMKRDAIYLLRTVHQHHVALSALADQKASFLLGGTIVILGFIATASQQASLPIHFIGLAIGSLIALLFCCAALTPRIHHHDPKAPGFNFLFCSHFISLDEADFIQRMKQVASSNESICESLSRDIYQMGRIIVRRKLRALQFAYAAFVFGIIFCSLGWVIASLF